MRRFVEAGGRLVVGGPGGAGLARPAARPAADAGRRRATGWPTSPAPVPEVQGVRAVRSSRRRLVRRRRRPAAGARRDGGARCSPSRDVGRGRIVLLADASPLQNRLLDQADNAALGLALAGPSRPPVLFAEGAARLRPVDAASPRSRPAGVWALLGLALAALVLALVRGPAGSARPSGRAASSAAAAARVRRVARPQLARTQRPRQRRREPRTGRGARCCAAGLRPATRPDAALRAAARRFGVEEDEVDALLDPEADRRDLLAAGRTRCARLAAAASERRGEGGIA